MTSQKEVYFVRHGESLGNRDGYMIGQDDVELTDKGRQQAARTAEKLLNKKADLMVSSSLIRAVETAEIIAGKIVYKEGIINDDRLKERHFGSWQGKPTQEFIAMAKEVGEVEFQKAGNMESLESLRDRTLSFWKWLKDRQERTIIVVGHHGYSQMLRTVIRNPKNYRNAFDGHLERIETGEFVKLKV